MCAGFDFTGISVNGSWKLQSITLSQPFKVLKTFNYFCYINLWGTATGRPRGAHFPSAVHRTIHGGSNTY